MKILNISQCDWARFSWDNANALKSVGIDCRSVQLSKHTFYDEQSLVYDLTVLQNVVHEYDVIQFFHDNVNLFKAIAPWMREKKIIVYHTSSFYRANHRHVNDLMAFADLHVCAMPEFMTLCPGAVYMVGAIDTDEIVPQGHTQGGQTMFAHYPSNPSVKGTEKIRELMSKCNVQIDIQTDIVPYRDQIDRMSHSDIYIELFSDQDGNGKPYGNFGITALEAAALGKIVITQCNDIEVYASTYGFCPFNLAPTEEKFIKHVNFLAQYSGDYIKGQQQLSREWVVKNHSYKASGEYILKNVLSKI